MGSRRVWFLCVSCVAICLFACAPRYTSRFWGEGGDEPPSAEIEAALRDAGQAYERGVDYFAKEQYDSAALYLEHAVSLLTQEPGWVPHTPASGERRLLVYKCRYFLERIPTVAVEEGPEAALEDVRALKPPLPSVEIVHNDRVQKWIDYFSNDARGNLVRWVKRSGKYRQLTMRILKEEGLPLELTNLALIESGFNPNAYSRAHAVGIWQFIKSTGRLYGLRADYWVDERRDPVKSCRAAARHLRDLYEALDSWPLAMAAYNSGQRNVEKAMRKARTDDYWKLSLKRETRDYVPMFMAAALITSDPAKYGFKFEFDDPIEFDDVRVDPRTSLKAIAHACDVPESVVFELNPHLVKRCAPDGGAGHSVRVPKGKAEICKAELARLPVEERIVKVHPAADGSHTVRRGETLSRIAQKYGTSVAAIAEANGIKNFNRLRPGQVLAIPGLAGSGGESRAALPQNPGVHTVRKGETLSAIAGKYGASVSDLARWNNLNSRHVLHVGQKLVVSGKAKGKHASSQEPPKSHVVMHMVKRGETIAAIAQRYGASAVTVLKTNGLKATDKIYPGQRIKVPVRAKT